MRNFKMFLTFSLRTIYEEYSSENEDERWKIFLPRSKSIDKKMHFSAFSKNY